MTLTPDDVKLLFELVGIHAAITGFMFYAVGWLLLKGLELVVGIVRKRGARAPFVERAEAFERRAQRLAATFERIAARNRREAIRRGDWVDSA